ncbi:MAG: hypothetical protein IPF99_32750 [Deltaproteobacteria bacterium]|nr:hypothetical protein [Deltaproteobacteria bacterium]
MLAACTAGCALTSGWSPSSRASCVRARQQADEAAPSDEAARPSGVSGGNATPRPMVATVRR